MSTPSRSLPPQPDLEQQKRLAKELLAAFRANDSDARVRIRTQLPDKARITLADAQFTLAREYGFASWSALRGHIAATTTTPVAPLDAMRSALNDGDAAALRSLLDHHPQLRARINDPLFSFDSPALVNVASREDVGLVNVLLAFGADPNRRSDWWAGGFHALHNASPAAAERLLAAGAIPDACAAAHLDRLDLLEAMLAADPTRVHERGGDGQTPLHFARSRAVVDRLLDAGADPDARDVDHRATPAQWMLARRRGAGRYDLAGYLVERGATPDIFLAAALGLTAHVEAMLRADPSLLELRCTQGEYAEKPPSSYHIYMWTLGADLSPLSVAARFEQHETLAVMRTFGSPRQLLLAALALADGADVHELLRRHPGLLATLRPEDQRALPEAAWSANAAAVALMLELGFDPATPGPAGGTALHCAAWEGCVDCVDVILRHPAAPDLITLRDTSFHGTPLGWCCHGSVHGPRHRDHATVARLLVAAGARPDPDPREMSDAVREVLAGIREG